MSKFSGTNNFIKARLKNIWIAGISICALFGIISAGVIIFYPNKLIYEKLICHASTNYKLPSSTSSSEIITSNEASFLKSFSKVFANLAKSARPALIMILAEKKVITQQQSFPEEFFFPFFPPQFGMPGGIDPSSPKRKRPQNIQINAGSGFIVDLKHGYAVTNNHMIDGAEKIVITTFDNHQYKASVVGTAKNLDIAVLKIEDFKANDQLKQLSLADSDKVEVGDWVIALGAPFELPQTLTMGVVSALKRSSDVLGIHGPNNFIQTDAPINPGNSGGPLVSTDGQAIGMNTAIYSKDGTSVGIGFAIPSNTIRLVADSIINNGKLTQSYLGIELYDISKLSVNALKELKIDSNTEGGLVVRVIPDSPAAKAGLKPYDIIQFSNGIAIKNPSDIQAQIMFLKPGTSVLLGILRNGKILKLKATVSELPKTQLRDGANSEQKKDEKTLAAEYGIYLSHKNNKLTHGVEIGRVGQGTVAEMAGLQAGDIILQVNRINVSSSQEVENILKKAKKSELNTLFLLVERDANQSAIILQIQ